MCFRFQQFEENTSDQDYERDLQRLFASIKLPSDFSQSGNIALTDKALVIPNHEKQEAVMWKFGLMPWWEKPGYNVQMTANARAETVDSKPSFREAFNKKRVLIPITGFYDWRLDPGEKKKTPYKAFLKSEEMFCLAGIYDGWKDPEGEIVHTFSIITSEPNELWAQVHNRMPVIMPREYYDLWLDPGAVDPAALKATLKPYPAKEMAYQAYDRYVSTSGNKDNKMIKAIGDVATG